MSAERVEKERQHTRYTEGRHRRHDEDGVREVYPRHVAPRATLLEKLALSGVHVVQQQLYLQQKS